MAVILFYQVTQDYLQYKMYLAISDFQYHENDLTLPTVTVCNKIPLIKKGYERVKNIVNITKKEFEEFHIRYFTRYRKRLGVNYTSPTEAKIFNALYGANITTTLDAIKLFEINQHDMFHDPVANLFLKSNVGDPHYPTCRYEYVERCRTKETMSNRESLCHQINFFEPNKKAKKGWRHHGKKLGNMITVVNVGTTERFTQTIDVRTQAPYMDLIEGLVVYVHPYGTNFDDSPQTRRVFLHTGMWHFLKMDHIHV